MNISKRTIGAVVLAAVAAAGYGGDAVVLPDEEVVGAGVIAQGALDLSAVWDKCIVNDELILLSSLGWEHVAEPESGKTVTLRLIPHSEGASQALASGLKGHRQTYVWTPGEVTKQIYNIKHSVIGGSPIETDLNAYFSFENYDQEAPSAADVHAAIRSSDGTGLKYGIANDLENWWTPTDGPDGGVAAPKGESKFKITVEGGGRFRFDYTLAGGTWTVKVDGVVVRTMDAATDWTGAEFLVDGALVSHEIEFETELSAGDSAALRNVRWIDVDDCFGGGHDSGGAVDLRTNEVLVVRRACELMPFSWSSTNFTGVVEIGPGETQKIDPQSVVSVRVVQVTGAGDDVSQWTEEIAGTAKTLVAEKQGEGSVKWKGVKAGVWKADLVIKTNGSETYCETRILDLRNYAGPGLMLFVM